jgi:hypothetical protein
MERLRQIFYEALISTSRFPRWWILALVQAACLYFIGEFLQPHYWHNYPGLLVLPVLGVLIMSPATVWLWLEIESAKLKLVRRHSQKFLIESTLAASSVIFCSIVLMIAAKLSYPDWLFSALISSLISATATLAILFIVLCRQKFGNSIILAFDTWNKKVSLAALVAFVLLLAHGASFALVHGTLKNFRNLEGFSVSAGSATIWILFSVGLLFTAFVAAFLNTFLVLLFLEIIGRKKDPETEKAAARHLVTSEATH